MQSFPQGENWPFAICTCLCLRKKCKITHAHLFLYPCIDSNLSSHCTCDVAATHRHIQKPFCILLEQEATRKLLQKTCSIKATQIIDGANTQLASALCRREGLLCIWGEEGFGSRPMTAKRLQLKVTWSDLTHSHPHLRLEKKFPITRSIAAQLDCKKKKKKLMTTSKWSCVFFVCLFVCF